jgi:hypothetical protein
MARSWAQVVAAAVDDADEASAREVPAPGNLGMLETQFEKALPPLHVEPPPGLPRPVALSSQTESTIDSDSVAAIADDAGERDPPAVPLVVRPWWSSSWLTDEQFKLLRIVEELVACCFGADYQSIRPLPAKRCVTPGQAVKETAGCDQVNLELRLASLGVAGNSVNSLALLQSALQQSFPSYGCQVVDMKAKDACLRFSCAAAPQQDTCWEAMEWGHCPRGPYCRWLHPEKVYFNLTLVGAPVSVSSVSNVSSPTRLHVASNDSVGDTSTASAAYEDARCVINSAAYMADEDADHGETS